MEYTEGIYKLKVLWQLMPQDFLLIWGKCLGKHFRGDGLILGPRHVPEGYAVFV